MILGHYTYSELVRRPGRTLLTLGGIVIGVAGVFAIALVINTTRDAYRAMFHDLTGWAALEIVAEGSGGFAASAAGDLAAVPGVKRAVPVIQTVAALLTATGPSGVMVLGTGPDGETAAPSGRIVAGHALAADDEIMLVENFARSLKIGTDAKVRLLSAAGAREFRVAGLLEPTGAAGFNGGGIVFVTLAAAQRLFGMPGQVTAIQLACNEGAATGDIERRLAERLPAGLTVRAPATRGQFAQNSLMATEQGLSTLSAVSIVAGAFVILNSFLMSLGERRKQLAILRAIGVTRRQVTRLLLREALLLGIVGMAVGIAVGLLTSMLLTHGMQKLLGVRLRGMELSLAPFLLAAVFGPGMAVAATLAPALRAAKRPPLADLMGWKEQAGDGFRRRPFAVGVVLLAISGALIVALLANWLPGALVKIIPAPLMGMFLVSGVLLSPAIYPYASRAVALLLRPLWGVEGRLAVRQLDRNATRTSFTAAVLCVALVVTIAMGQTIRNNIGDVEEWSLRTITADYLVRSTLPDLGFSIGALLPESMHDELAAIDGVEQVHDLNFVQATAAGQPVIVLARSFDRQATGALDVAEADREAVIRGLWAGEAVIGTALAQRMNLAAGDSLTLRTRKGERTVRVAGKVTEYVAGGVAVYLERGVAKELFAIDGVDVFMVSARPGAATSLGKTLAAYCQERGLLLQSNAEFRERIHQMMGGVVGFLWLLMALVFVVASLGIVNTLTMNVIEQTREIAVLRSVAMQRRQIRWLVLFQALGLGLSSLLPGTAMGLVLAYLMNLSTRVLAGQIVDFRADAWFVAACCGACLATALAAAWFPARRASRLAIVQALQYE
ncbi:MAG: ABC transporter permease [Planctomycetia bacterium]|nr:ABC transporter permease [Planctomycetia bacterium]